MPPARGQAALLPEAVERDPRQLSLDPSERARQQAAERARRLRGATSVPSQPALMPARQRERPSPETVEPSQPSLLSAEPAGRTVPAADADRFREYVEAQRSLRDRRDAVTRDIEIRVLDFGTPTDPSFGIEVREGGMFGRWRSLTPREGRFSSEPAAIAEAVQKLWRQYRAEPIENPQRVPRRASGSFKETPMVRSNRSRQPRSARTGRFVSRGGRRRRTRRNPSELDLLLDNPRRRRRARRSRSRFDLLLDNPRRRRRARPRRRSFSSLLLDNPRRRRRSSRRRVGYSNLLLDNPRRASHWRSSRRMPGRSARTGRFVSRR